MLENIIVTHRQSMVDIVLLFFTWLFIWHSSSPFLVVLRRLATVKKSVKPAGVPVHVAQNKRTRPSCAANELYKPLSVIYYNIKVAPEIIAFMQQNSEKILCGYKRPLLWHDKWMDDASPVSATCGWDPRWSLPSLHCKKSNDIVSNSWFIDTCSR